MKKVLQILLIFIWIQVFSQAPVNIIVKDATGSENMNVTCTNNLDANGCLALHVEYPVLKETSSYQVTPGAYNPPIAINQGTALNANYDDLFAKKLDLPFKFCFFNQYFDALVVGSNGMITFNTSQLGNINYPNIQWQNPSTSLPKNSIFGAYHDIVFSSSDASEIYYSTIGAAPYRKFIINFFEGRVSGCTERSSSQIVLYETTNVIDVFIDKKELPCPTRKFENALIGILNSDGTQGYSPSNRNTGVWEAVQEGWRFQPVGNVIEPQVTWKNSAGQTVGTGIQTTVCPTQNEVYTANVLFNICGNSQLALSDDFTLTFDSSYPAAKNYSQNFCGNTPVNLNLNSFQSNLTSQNPASFNFSFHNSLLEAQNGVNALPTNYTLTNNTVLYVRIQNPLVPTCYRVAVLTLNFLAKSLLKDTVEICDTNNDGVEQNYNLSLLNPELFAQGTPNISYYLTQSDAQNNANAVTNANITANTTLWVRVKEGNCTYVLGPVHFQFKPGVNLNTPINYTYSVCDINADNQEPFDYELNIGPLITTQTGATFRAYNTYNEAYNGQGSVLNKIKEGVYIIYVRVDIPNGCFAVATVNMNVTFDKIIVNPKEEYICFNGTDDISIDLNALSSGMLVSPTTVPVKQFYASAANAENETNPISPNQTITTDGSMVTKTYFVRFEISNTCYTIKPITVHLVHPVIFKSSFEACDFDNDNSENISLAQYSSAIIGTQNASVLYYLTQADAQNANNPITNITVTGTQQVFVGINSFNCKEVYPITLSLSSTPTINSPVTINLNNICDNNNDGSEPYDLTQAQSQIYAGSDTTFRYYANYDLATHALSNEITNPTQFSVSGNAVVYVKVKFNNNECFSVATLNINMTFLPPVVLKNATLETCDENFDLNETFHLNDAIPQLFIPAQNTLPLSDMTITYYHTQTEANAGNPSNQMGNSFVATVSSIQVWARFQSKSTGCFSTAPIQLNTYFPPKAITSTITVCDENLDGTYDVNLLNFTDLMVDIPNAANSFSFYLTQQDAQNDTNAITNPSNYSANPFPAKMWVKVQNIPGCDDIAEINFVLGTKITLQNPGPFKLETCDTGNNSVEVVNLTQFQNQIYTGANAVFVYYPSLADLNAGTNAIASPASFSYNLNAGSNTVYVKVSTSGYCPEVVQIKLLLKETPIFNIPTQYFCPDGSLDYTVHVEGYNIVSYTWTNPSGQVVSTTDTITGITQIGTYSLTVKADNGCTFTETFEVKYFDVPVIQKLEFTGNSVKIIAVGSQPILYSLDGVTWQASNMFYNLPTGITTFYVKYVEGKCIVKQDGVVLDIKNAITPNGDGFNDRWIIKNLHVFGGKMTNVKIYDRYQYLIFEQNTNTEIIWDGTIRGRAIPTASYWYIITIPDGRSFNGWILVKNNN